LDALHVGVAFVSRENAAQEAHDNRIGIQLGERDEVAVAPWPENEARRFDHGVHRLGRVDRPALLPDAGPSAKWRRDLWRWIRLSPRWRVAQAVRVCRCLKESANGRQKAVRCDGLT
jgi:hypothetical protein